MFKKNVYRKPKHTFYIQFFFNRAVYEIIWTNIAQPGRPQMTLRRTRVACWIPKATNTHFEYVILTTFPQQQWPHEGTSMLRPTYIARLVLKSLKPEMA
jgi:hypothetical protein